MLSLVPPLHRPKTHMTDFCAHGGGFSRESPINRWDAVGRCVSSHRIRIAYARAISPTCAQCFLFPSHVLQPWTFGINDNELNELHLRFFLLRHGFQPRQTVLFRKHSVRAVLKSFSSVERGLSVFTGAPGSWRSNKSPLGGYGWRVVHGYLLQ